MSFGRRVELMRQVRELARRMEFLEAGQEPATRWMRRSYGQKIDRLYLTWGLRAVSGLALDGSDGNARTARGGGTGGPVPGGAGGGAGRDRADAARTKKLIVAFHFQFSNQAGWRCDVCRRIRPGDQAAMRVAARRHYRRRRAASVGPKGPCR